MSHAGLGHEPPVVKAFASPPGFVVDVMLGNLARWLRFLGFDAEFGPDFDDDLLLRRANASGRVLLTADRELAARPALRNVVVLSPSSLQEQWTALARALNLGPWIRPLTRCPGCGRTLRDLPRDRARDRVPPYVFDTYTHFLECPACARVFWPGTHHPQIAQRIRAMSDMGQVNEGIDGIQPAGRDALNCQDQDGLARITEEE